MLDKEFLVRKIKLIQEDLERLKEYKRYSLDEIAQDYRKMAVVERLLEKIIMRAIDINQHIIAELGHGKEEIRSYEDTFLALANLGIYPEKFAKMIAPSAGLRNRLVHEYNHLDEKIVYQSIGEALDQYIRYCQYILDFIKTSS